MRDAELKTVAAATIALTVLTALAGCHRGAWSGDDAGHGGRGHFAGVGIYQPNLNWTQLAEAPTTNSQSAAKRVDDQAIVVVVDTNSGEIRACGDLSGYCVAQNPWRTGLPASQLTPVPMAAHAAPRDGTAPDVNSAPAATAP